MELRPYGRTGLRVSPLALGGMEMCRTSQANADRIIGEALDSGVTYIDTSRDYPESELKIGRALGARRAEVIIATKCGCNPHLEAQNNGNHVHIWDKQTLQRNLDRSLRDLGTDYIDVWQMHMATPDDLCNDPDHEAIRFMRDAQSNAVHCPSPHTRRLATDWRTIDTHRCRR